MQSTVILFVFVYLFNVYKTQYIIFAGMSVFQGCRNKTLQTECLSNRSLSSHCYEVQTSEIKLWHHRGWAGSSCGLQGRVNSTLPLKLLVASVFLGLQMAFSLCLHNIFHLFMSALCLTSRFLQGHSHIVLGLTLMILTWTSVKTISRTNHIHKY